MGSVGCREAKNDVHQIKKAQSNIEKEQLGGVGSGLEVSPPPLHSWITKLHTVNARTPVIATKEDEQRDNSWAGMGWSIHPLF